MSLTPRQELLLKLYDQLWNSINRQILVVWQSVSILVGAFAILALVEKKVVPLDIAVTIIIILSTWLLCHVYDSSLWYNRNLAIIANIEKLFLIQSDLQEVHYFFKDHRDPKMIGHLSLQKYLGILLTVVIMAYHFFERVAPGFSAPFSNFEFMRAIPYFIALFASIFVLWFRKKSKKSYETFIDNSPGVTIVEQENCPATVAKESVDSG